MAEFKDRFELALEMRNMKPADLARLTGINEGAISQYRKGAYKATQRNLEKISKVLNVSIPWLMGAEDQKSSASAPLVIDYGSSTISPLVKKAPSVSEGALKLAKDYDALDNWGRKQVRDVADNELARVEDESRFLAEVDADELKPEPKVIPFYLSPAAAGYAAPVLNEEYELYALGPDDPQGADFAVRLHGDSMEPDFPDGTRVFCNRDPLAAGDIGVFLVDGATVCKQYFKSNGYVYLFSLNRRRRDADVVLPPDSGRAFACLGRVITRRRYPLPHEA